MRPRGGPALEAGLATALVLAACGSTSLSLIQLHSRASAICTVVARRLAAIPAPRSGTGTRPFLERGAAALRAELGQLRRLAAPRERVRVYQAALRAIAGELNALRIAIAALAPGSDTIEVFKALQSRLGPLEAASERAWRALGVEACMRQ